MKLAFIPSWYPTDKNPSDGTFFREWAMYFADAGHDVSVIASLIHPLSRVFTRPFEKAKETVIKRESGSLTEYIQEAINIHPYLEKEFYKRYSDRACSLFKQVTDQSGLPDAAIIHSSIWAGGALSQNLEELGVPFIVFEHLKEVLNPEKLTSIQRTALRNSWRNAKNIIAISTAMMNSYNMINPKYSDKIIYLANPVDTGFFNLPEQRPSNGFNFVTVALHRPEKRIDYLLRSFAKTLEKHPLVTLEIHGNGPELERNRTLALKLGLEGHVHFAGFSSKTEIRSALYRAHCFIMSSGVETFGLAALEALSTGIPVISTDCGGPSDFINDKNGVLIPVSKDISILANAMNNMVEGMSKYDPLLIRKRIVDRFDKKIYVYKCMDLLRDASNQTV